MTKRGISRALLVAALTAAAFAAQPASAASGGLGPLRPKVDKAVAFDLSQPLREQHRFASTVDKGAAARPEFGAGPVGNHEHSADGALQKGVVGTTAMPGPLFTFEGPSNEANFTFFGIRVNPPDPVGDVGRNHYVTMVNLTYAVYSKTGTLLLGPADTGALWAGFGIDDCTRPNGDPIVLYDEKADRWILTQFTTQGPEYFNCVAVSVTGDPTGAYYRYAFSTGLNFPDYPKYGIWPKDDDDNVNEGSVTITTREFDPADNESIGIYAVNRSQLMAGDPDTQVVSFNLAGPPNLVGDGLLPADFDGERLPRGNSRQLIVGSQDNDAPDGATFDALNVFQLDPNFQHPERSTFLLKSQLATAPFDSIYPCAPTSRDCLPQPGIVDPNQYLDILSYRQRPTWRLQYRNFGPYEALVTNQSVEARPNVAGVRWYELRNTRAPFIYQQGTYAPTDGVHRWMGSVAMDEAGNMAAGYSVVNGTTVKPGIRYAGRLSGDPLGTLAQGEATIINGTGVQTTTNSRWGDYTSLNVDPSDNCTFYYFNEYYLVDGTPADTRPWKTRVGAFRFPGCS
jgi:hypothetical protein